MIILIKENQKYFNRLHILIDALVVSGSYFLAFYFKFESGFANGILALSKARYFQALLFIVPSYLILYGLLDCYSIDF